MSKLADYNVQTPEEGDTALSIVQLGGNLYVVDQHGKMVRGLIKCSATTEVDALTTITLTCYAHKVNS